MAYLEVKDLHVSYGAIKAVRGVSFAVERGEIVTVIGSNGAGKSTIMNTLAALIKPVSGSIIFNGEDVTNAPPYSMVNKGLTLSPEGRQIFPRLTVEENLQMGSYTITDKTKFNNNIEEVYSLFPILRKRYKQLGGTLSGGEQQMLAIARAMMSEPELLILDEPSLGLAPIIVQELFKQIQHINRLGTTILLVEQNACMALRISDRGYVLETGKIVLSDTGKGLSENKMVNEAYLGGF